MSFCTHYQKHLCDWLETLYKRSNCENLEPWCIILLCNVYVSIFNLSIYRHDLNIFTISEHFCGRLLFGDIHEYAYDWLTMWYYQIWVAITWVSIRGDLYGILIINYYKAIQTSHATGHSQYNGFIIAQNNSSSYSHYFKLLPLDKMATRLADDIFRCIFVNENFFIDKNFTEVCS